MKSDPCYNYTNELFLQTAPPEITQMMESDDVDIASIGKKKTALLLYESNWHFAGNYETVFRNLSSVTLKEITI